MKGFRDSVNNKTFEDIHFIVESKTIYGHSCILKYRCPALLPTGNSKDIVIRDVEHAVFLEILTYLYTDNIECDKALLPKIIKSSEKFNLLRLKKLCQDQSSSTLVEVPESTFKEDFHMAVNNPEYSDVIFIVENKSLYGHRRILSRQEYFRVMFSTQLRESNTREITISGIRYDVFYVLVYYTYCWKIPNLTRRSDDGEFDPDMVLELFEATHRFMIEGLKHSVESYLCSNLTLENVCPLFQLAESFKSPFLLEECFDFILMNFKVLKDTQEFQELHSELKLQIVEYIEKQNQKKIKQKSSKDDNYSLL